MLFSSLPFLFFFLPLFFISYFIAKKRSTRNILLLCFSLFFYAWGEPIYIFLMIFSIAINYWLALAIDQKQKKGAMGKEILTAAVIINLALIGVFKYADFFINTLNSLTGANLAAPHIPLPIGISFYTFQILSYVIDVYRKTVKPQQNILFLGAYVVGFPQLIAGPIVRYETIAEELISRQESLDEFAVGSRRFIAGLAKKVLIANNMAAVADGIFVFSSNDYGALGAWIAILAYTLQIYFDFSAYSDMAIGMGRMMGFHYLENFNYPYVAKSVTDFWRRWHISLSTFFRDYVYIPLGGNRVTTGRWAFNMIVVWLLTGLWHGASWNFVLWGVYFGILLIIEKMLLQKHLDKLPLIGHLYAILAFVFGWVIFRAESIQQIGSITSAMFGAKGAGTLDFLIRANVLQLPYMIAGLFGILCSMPISRYLKKTFEKNIFGQVLIDISSWVVLLYCVAVLAIGSYNPFIYFRF